MGVSLGLVAVSLAVAAGAADGELELLVRGPDARPVAGAEVRCLPERYPDLPGGHTARETTDRTDAAGLVRLPWPVGVSRVRVSVPGVGHGLTGLVEVLPAGTVRAPLPPLVPFAVLEGAVPADVIGPTPTVTASGGSPHTEVPATVEGSRFRATVPAGRWEVTATGNGRKAVLPGSVQVAPGQTVGGLVLRPVPPPPAGGVTAIPFDPSHGRGQTVTWAAGTVRDAAGQPVAGATVWGYATYHGGIRTVEMVRSTTTDRDGRYELTGDGGLSLFSASLVAHRPGRPPAWAWVQSPPFDPPPTEFVGPPALPRPPVVDLVLPDAGGRLEVTVERDGKPAAGVPVTVANEGVWLKEQWAVGGDTPERQAVKAVVHPVVRTDEAGRAAFDALLPGRYRVVAAATEEKYVRQIWDWSDSLRHVSHGEAEGVPVAVAQTTARRLVVRPPLPDLAIHAVRPDGSRLNTRETPINHGRPDGAGGWSSTVTVGLRSGSGLSCPAVGLWWVGFQYRDTPTPSRPLSGPPFYTADGVVAVSRLLPGTVDQPGWTREPVTQPAGALPPPKLTARRIEPGSLVVELRDAADRPARGYVTVGSPGMIYGLGATDEAGVVRFAGLMAHPVVATGQLVGRPPVDLGEYEGLLPDDAALTGATAVTAEKLTPAPDAEARVVLREQPVGYVRATLRPPAGASTADYVVYLTEAAPPGAGVHYRPSTGECVAGPFPPGEARLRVIRHGRTGGDAGTHPVTVTAGAVTRADLRPQAGPRLARAGGGLIGVGGIHHLATGAGELVGTVLLPDGKTPALAARVWHFEPGRPQPVLGGLTDAAGRVRGKGLWHSPGWPAADGPAGPTAVALLPGSHGAVVVPAPPGRPLRVVLPPAAAVRGRVTVAGAAPPPLGTVRVLAAHQDRGRLGGLADVRATAQPDGTFELTGLTPGRYLVQAAVDDLWLSPAAAVEVAGGGPPAPLTLAVPALGGPVTVTVADAAGRPLPGRPVTLDRPAGPLADTLWPAVWTADGAGEVRVPALEAGRHRVRVTGAEAVTVEVPPLAAGRAAETTVRVTPAR